MKSRRPLLYSQCTGKELLLGNCTDIEPVSWFCRRSKIIMLFVSTITFIKPSDANVSLYDHESQFI